MKQVNLLGIVGANLTSALLCLEASKRGIKTILLDKELNNIAAGFATTHILAEPDGGNIEKLMLRVDAIAFCTPDIPVKSEHYKLKVPMYPSKQGIEILNKRVNLLELATRLEIPVPSYYYQNNKEDIFEKIEDIDIPFAFYQFYEDAYEVVDVLETEEIPEFLGRINEKAEEWLIEQINDYQKILSITIIKDAKGKVCSYPLVEEMLGDEEINYMNTPAKITKTMSQKVIRYAKKLVKEIDTEGVFTLKFGMKSNKSIELVSINPGITIGDIATLHYADISLYEQYINMICGMEIVEPTMTRPNTVIVTKDEKEPVGMKLPYHLYVMDKDTQSPIKIYIKDCEETQ